MAPEIKPRTVDGYRPDVTLACERALVTLMGAFATLGPTVRLVGGLAPRYITPAMPPFVPAHSGTSDVDIVFNLQVITEGRPEGYAKLATQLEAKGFRRYVDEDKKKHSWRWTIDVGGIPIMVEFLREAGDREPGSVITIAGEKLSALAIKHSEITHDWFVTHRVEAEVVSGGLTVEHVAVADVVAFVILKAVSLQQRKEPKDAADLVHVLTYAGKPAEVAAMFVEKHHCGLHREALAEGVAMLRQNFCDADMEKAIKRIGPVMFSQFHLGEMAEDEDEFTRMCRDAASLVTEILDLYDAQVLAKSTADA